MKRKTKMILLVIFVVLVVFVVVFFSLIPLSKGQVPEILDENDSKIAGSIAEKSTIEIDGCDMGLIILSENDKNPVLLVCGGGPGIPQYLVEYMYPSVLKKYFTVCYFDYRGTGLSYFEGINTEDMTSERYLNDVDAITDYLSERFAKDKIYIMGHSFGTYMALNTVKRHPEKYEAYFAVSQITNQMESELRAYDYMYNEYLKMGNSRMLKEFDKYPIRESEEAYDKYCTSGLRDKAMHDLGVGTTRDMKSVISGIFLKSLRCKTYTVSERINIWKGKAKANGYPVTKDAFSFNAFDSISSIDIPVYFLAGEYDYTCCESLQKEYFDTLEAPLKQYYKFDNTAHSPLYEDSLMADKIFEKILDKTVRID